MYILVACRATIYIQSYCLPTQDNLLFIKGRCSYIPTANQSGCSRDTGDNTLIISVAAITNCRGLKQSPTMWLVGSQVSIHATISSWVSSFSRLGNSTRPAFRCRYSVSILSMWNESEASSLSSHSPGSKIRAVPFAFVPKFCDPISGRVRSTFKCRFCLY